MFELEPDGYVPAHVDRAVAELLERVSVEPERIMLIGAGCRDVWHSALAFEFDVRRTTDTDLGITIDDEQVIGEIDRAFEPLGGSGIRYRIGGHAVDVIPFGGVEDPAGITRPAPRGDDLVVFGFADVYEHSLPLELPHGSTIRIPDPAGYAALKLRAWIDRSPQGEYKDAQDLALVLHWYQHRREINDRLYGTEEGEEILLSVDFDVGLAAATLLGLDVQRRLSPENHADLVRRWAATDVDELVRSFRPAATVVLDTDRKRLRQLIDRVTTRPAT